VDKIVSGMKMIPNYLARTGYRLLTEAEWEASARAGTTATRFYGSDPSVEILGIHSWNYHNSGPMMHPVGQTIPNAFGLFDTLGNAYEFCHDVMADYPTVRDGLVVDGPLLDETIGADSLRILRGGAFHRGADGLRSAARQVVGAGTFNQLVGFRIARTIPPNP
jgi:eukaryotic-like serine/threonine-protein kinase